MSCSTPTLQWWWLVQQTPSGVMGGGESPSVVMGGGLAALPMMLVMEWGWVLTGRSTPRVLGGC